MQKRLDSTLAGLILMIFGLSTAQATLIDRGNGLIYDDVQDITWMADANYAVTSGYAAANEVDNGAGATDNISSTGIMGWDAAVVWAGQLSYGGYDDWRLLSVDESCSGFNCSSAGNELGHLFYEDLKVLEGNSILSSLEPELAFFTNIQSRNYWSGVEYTLNTDNVWYFLGSSGYQINNGDKTNEFYTWAVRSGDVAASVPEPASLLLLLSGLLGIRGIRVLQQRL